MNRISVPLRKYIEHDILPMYDNFDAAHNIEHVKAVVLESLRLAQYYDVDINMVYVIAVYHDLGLAYGRHEHHLRSGEILCDDEMIRRFFSEEKMQIMREAVEDHRASSDHEPRSIYGKIVAEADRDIIPTRILRRTIQYGLKYFPHLDNNAQYDRFLNHLIDKYSESGYIKLWIPQSKNYTRLKELRTIISDRVQLRSYFDKMFNSLISE